MATKKQKDKDDLDLRDEILNLKREIAALRKDRDKLVIRLRKSDDESRRKDRQIEQLMDPSQNSEIRRLLSMKGAALLLNLKDQNNTLVQMLMEKNQHIKRLANEIKTAKLYARTNKTETYRLEISRLRSLLLQSQEALKEAAQGPHVPSACLSVQSRSSSTETACSSQELEDLRFMVRSLETHMQYSKELICKKNQEIAALSRELEGRCQRKPGRCASASVLDKFQVTEPRRKSVGEKWKAACGRVLRNRRIHTNATADDSAVWSVLQPAVSYGDSSSEEGTKFETVHVVAEINPAVSIADKNPGNEAAEEEEDDNDVITI